MISLVQHSQMTELCDGEQISSSQEAGVGGGHDKKEFEEGGDRTILHSNCGGGHKRNT